MFKTNANLLKTLFLIGLFLISCSKDDHENSSGYSESFVNLATHQLKAYSVSKKSKYLIVCESGLGDGHESWMPSGEKSELIDFSSAVNSDILIYDRAGYGKSGIDNKQRDINTLRIELEAMIDKYAKGRKVILIGHSLGGMIIRDYAIKNPDKSAAILFIDPMHEKYNNPEAASIVYDAFVKAYGANFAGAKEAKEITTDLAYGSSLPILPNIPVVVLTSMKPDENNNTADEINKQNREKWFEAHEQLGKGITDFTHIATVKSGHYIHHDEPELVIDNIKFLISKLP
ncbi:alpha/beta fold hydrolase [Flavobacterium poyangense]|uniref:alpha/beta fold hydrolase n=1 Tax=Flavobacterium poyangense TaxID=2204302 RepID=UPI0014228D2B|nr:alpha/beta fold hydrolase [Flavobacterium sp. JXAS1]